MGKHRLFSPAEWQALQFAVLDVFTMVSQIEGPSGMDEAEQNAFIDLLVNPSPIDDPLLRDLLASIASTWKHVLDAYSAQYRYDEGYFEQAFSRVQGIVDRTLATDEGTAFKVALAAQLGGIIANASGTPEPGLGRLSEDELEAITAISIWLGADAGQEGP